MKDINSFNAEGTLLHLHQNRMLEILQYFDSVCRANNITYWLSSGTLIGAVRHGGFIPWDDDVDVEMLRKDYRKLCKILKKDQRYDFQNHQTDKYYVHPYAKFRDRNSLISEFGQDYNYKYKGVYIDIFIIEYSHFLPAYFFDILSLKLLLYGSRVRSKNSENLFLFLKKILYLSINVVRFIEKFIPGKTLRHTIGAGFSTKVRNEKKIFPLTTIQFENIEFPAPSDTDYYLTTLYGDYMKLPNLDTIHPHITKIELF